MLNFIWTVLAMALCALLYRAGGMGKEETAKPTWMPMWMRNTKARDVGVPIIVWLFLICVGFWEHPILAVFAFLMLFGSLTSYWHYHMQGKKIMNFWLHGFMCGVAAAPIAYATGHWWLFLLRCVILAVWSGVWSLAISRDWVEEGGRLLPLVPTFWMIL